MEVIQIKKKKKKELSKSTVNIIRTTQRNNIDLTQLADNKANVLLSLNAIMLTFLLPLILPNFEIIVEQNLYIPLVIFTVTCFLTILIAAIVLKPASFQHFRATLEPNEPVSPFFFGNFYKMEPKEFWKYLNENVEEEYMVKRHLAQDLFYIGRVLGFKMTWIRRAFNIFLIGIFLSILSSALILTI